MKKAIYKIENKINHKLYIGQTLHPEERFKQHNWSNTETPFHKAIKKYGINNFEMEVLGWYENYDEMEIYYIEYYRSLIPNGYNVSKGGSDPPHYKGEKNSAAKISNETAYNIKCDLKNWNIPRKNIQRKYNVSFDCLRHINEGESWYDENESYPLRPPEKELNNIKAKKIIEDLLLTTLSCEKIAKQYGWCRSAAKMINEGKNHFDEKLIYPIRNHIKENKAILNL